MTDQDTANERIESHLTKWNGTHGPHLDAFTGFVAFTNDMLIETFQDLQRGDFDQVADDIAYSIDQERGTDAPSVTVQQVAAWVEANRDRLIEAITDASEANQ